MGWQTVVAVQVQAGNTIINPSGTFVYSSAPAAGNLVTSDAPAGGTDQFGNHFLAGVASYAAGLAAQMGDGFIAFYSGSLSAGWTSGGTIFGDGSGDLTLTGATISIQGSTAVAISGTTTINGSGSTGACDSNLFGLTTSGASAGTAHTHTLPFQNPTATHAHPL